MDEEEEERDALRSMSKSERERMIPYVFYPLQRFRSKDNDRTRSGQAREASRHGYGAYSTAFE
jgi:hypothetical protein